MNQTLAAPNGIAFDNLGDLAAISSASPFGVAGFQRTQLIPAKTGPTPNPFLVGATTTLNAPAGCNFGLSLTNRCLGSQLRVLLSLKNPSAEQNAATSTAERPQLGKHPSMSFPPEGDSHVDSAASSTGNAVDSGGRSTPICVDRKAIAAHRSSSVANKP